MVSIDSQQIHDPQRVLLDQVTAGAVGDPIGVFLPGLNQFSHKRVHQFGLAPYQVTEIITHRCVRIGRLFLEQIP